MRRTYSILLFLLFAVATLLAYGAFCRAAENKDQTSAIKIPKRKRDPSKLSEEDIARIMGRMKRVNPDKAQELESLRKIDPEKFITELKKAVRAGYRTGNVPRKGASLKQGIGASGWGGRPEAAEFIKARYDKHLEWLKRNYPDEAQRLAELKETQPDEYAEQMAISLKKYGSIASAAGGNPELAKALKERAELSDQADELASQIKATTGEAEKEELVERLEEVVGRKYDLGIRIREIRHEQLVKKLEDLETRVEESKADIKKWKSRRFKRENIKTAVKDLISSEQKPKDEWKQ